MAVTVTQQYSDLLDDRFVNAETVAVVRCFDR